MRKHTQHLGGWLLGALACSVLGAAPAVLSASPAGAQPAAGSVPTLKGDIPVVGDWDGNGTETIGVFRSGTWYLRNANGGGAPDLAFTWGSPGDVPVVGDWDGDGRDMIGVFRNGIWYLRNSNSGGPVDAAFGWGSPDDVPVVGDWNGDGVDSIGVFRNGTWYERNSNNSGPVDTAFGWGAPSDVPVVGDWDGDGRDTIGVRRSNNYYLRKSNNGGGVDVTNTVGAVADVTVVGRFDGSISRTGVRSGATFILPTNNGTVSFDYGQASVLTAGSTADEQRILELVNSARANAGCPALTIDNRLTVAALDHSRDMANRGYFEHVSPDGITPWARMTAAGYNYSAAGENIAAGYSSTDAVFNGWMNSSGHRANILNCSFRNMGLSMVNQPGSPWTYYWTQMFGTL